MTNRVYWNPALDPSAQLYTLFSASSPAKLAQNPADLDSSLLLLSYVPGALMLLARVPAARTDANFEATTGRYFYDDVAGTPDTVYSVQGLGSRDSVLSETGVFQIARVQTADLVTRVKVDHNYGGIDALRVLTLSGAPIPDTVIRAYTKPDFDAGRTDLALLVGSTDFDGRWLAPFFLTPGMTYVLVFENYGLYGPNKFEIIV